MYPAANMLAMLMKHAPVLAPCQKLVGALALPALWIPHPSYFVSC